jgi:hypothetical protein
LIAQAGAAVSGVVEREMRCGTCDSVIGLMEQPINPLNRFTTAQLVQEIADRGHKVEIDRQETTPEERERWYEP